jgi:thioredoxin 1
MSFAEHYTSREPSRQEVEAVAGLTVIEFGAPWCPVCRGAQPWIRAAITEHPEARHLKIEDGSGRPLGRSFGVRLWPTLVVLRDGREQGRVVRPTDRASIARMLESVAAG